MRVPSELPGMVLPEATLFPQSILPVRIDEPRHRRLLADVLEGARMIFVAMRKPGTSNECAEKVGGVGLVRVCLTHRDGSSDLLLEGLTRARLEKTLRYRPYRICRLTQLRPRTHSAATVNTLLTTALELTCRLLAKLPLDRLVQIAPPQATDPQTLVLLQRAALDNLVEHLRPNTTPDQLVNLVSACLLSNPSERQLILETQEVELRLRRLIRILHRQIDAEQTTGQPTATAIAEGALHPRTPFRRAEERDQEEETAEEWESEDEEWEEPDFEEDEEEEDWIEEEEDDEEEEDWNELSEKFLADIDLFLGDPDVSPQRPQNPEHDDDDEDLSF